MPHPVDLHVGNRLRIRRNATGLSQGDLATTLGITFQQVQKYERGANRMSASRLYEIAQALKVPIQYFFEGLEKRMPMGMAEETAAFKHEMPGLTPETSSLIDSFQKLDNPNVRKYVLKLVNSMADGQPTLEDE